MTIWLRFLPYIAALMLGATGAWMWQANSYDAIISANEASRQAELAQISAAGAAQARHAVEKQQAAEQALAALDQKAQKEKTDALAENEKLRSDVAAGTRRLRIAGSCRASGGDLSSTTGTAGVDHAGTVELTGTAGRTVLDVRSGIIADQAALKALQEYVTHVCLSKGNVQ
ncbi:lysis system i-spanin subunit Rz [Pseudomonas koreensis]|uniref:Lysis protein n=1 Tax=Pseudomonas koreensis TaxID=198620 RepID=A0AA94EN94_9PSED|nr:lysis system i-spanin subunit Rz [Pseudomonas koreensis]RVD76988.1 lysis protein [Pseudomonas koreensis]